MQNRRRQAQTLIGLSSSCVTKVDNKRKQSEMNESERQVKTLQAFLFGAFTALFGDLNVKIKTNQERTNFGYVSKI